ncbi:GntR family transcriptional regulator [Bacillus sp. FJAT-29814]|uniref:GntR family transcriptional regulator n=1 Tax=Bacillus sp. FJAT-29814 TaxID=1729688 RepID=UPI000833B8D2|nr:winged helix-turn-helix domain-containing protein [Bacillus sp. FJAT-29814]
MIILLNSDTPHYLQIYNHIKREIATDHLQANDKLPSIRKLAEFLGISTTPVEQSLLKKIETLCMVLRYEIKKRSSL